nr:hypothetical protein [uncultured Flavobacterium sp.]
MKFLNFIKKDQLASAPLVVSLDDLLSKYSLQTATLKNNDPSASKTSVRLSIATHKGTYAQQLAEKLIAENGTATYHKKVKGVYIINCLHCDISIRQNEFKDYLKEVYQLAEKHQGSLQDWEFIS